jgi:hypothetical protein
MVWGPFYWITIPCDHENDKGKSGWFYLSSRGDIIIYEYSTGLIVYKANLLHLWKYH